MAMKILLPKMFVLNLIKNLDLNSTLQKIQSLDEWIKYPHIETIKPTKKNKDSPRPVTSCISPTVHRHEKGMKKEEELF